MVIVTVIARFSFNLSLEVWSRVPLESLEGLESLESLERLESREKV